MTSFVTKPEYGIETLLKNNGLDTSVVDSSYFGSQGHQVLKRLQQENSDDNYQIVQEAPGQGPDDDFVPVESAGEIKAFTLNSAYEQIGGFGRFQFLVVIIFSLLRNSAQWPVYLFGMSMEPQEYLCREKPEDAFDFCSTTFICSKRAAHEKIEFKPLDGTNYFFDNLYVQYDLMCTPSSAYNSIGSFYFVGYGIGAMFFFLPDAFGRKNVMSIFMTFIMMATYMSSFAGMGYMRLGFFLIGFFHLKISLSYTYAAELVPEVSK